MPEKPFEPSTVTKPIQLLAAWLLGLILINGSFLGAAAGIRHPSWAAGFLVICAALNVPLFLAALFLLQTKFRPEMQEDTFYARYLERKSAETQKIEYVQVAEERPMLSLPNIQRRERAPNRSGFSAEIQINDLLPSFDEIIEKLSENGIKPARTFGSTSAQPEAPRRFVISFSDDVQANDIQKVLEYLEEFPVDGLSIAEGGPFGNTIYIGSYVYRDFEDRVTAYTPDLRQKLLRRGLTRKNLRSLVKAVPD